MLSRTPGSFEPAGSMTPGCVTDATDVDDGDEDNDDNDDCPLVAGQQQPDVHSVHRFCRQDFHLCSDTRTVDKYQQHAVHCTLQNNENQGSLRSC